MCKHLVSLVFRKRAGSALRKAVLGYMADRASEDGSGIWCSKGRIARETEFSLGAVKKAVREFVSEGVLIETGKRRHENGETTIYTLVKEAVDRMPDAKECTTYGVTPSPDDPVTEEPGHSEPETRSPHDPLPGHSEPPNLPKNHPEPPPKEQTSPALTFSRFWEEWPLARKDRKKAEAAFKRLSQADRSEAIRRCRDWAQRWRAANPNLNDIHPTTYLNGKRWEDEFSSAQIEHLDPKRARWRKIAAGGRQ